MPLVVWPRESPSWHRMRSPITKPTMPEPTASTMHAPVTASMAAESGRLSPALAPPLATTPTRRYGARSRADGLDGDLEVTP